MIEKVPEMLPKEQYLQLPSYEREHYLRNIIRKTIEMNPNGVTANEISKKLEVDPRAVDKHLTMLLHTNLIYVERYDEKEVYLHNGKSLHPVYEKTLEVEGKKYEVFRLRNRRGEFVLLQEKISGEVRDDVMAGVLIPLRKFSTFVDYMVKVRDEMVHRGFAEKEIEE
jgi:DNA-binding transcriptional ArsR family regulator